ncbi:hypothetical protein [Aequorivita xiaoshiensis]|uniref:Uncharacterized protein n=1 Tax=Aequorivita xiaoshiensis TaxID=2874476 RepID=A0A9X1R6X9_9FLAO|nr:hypothetical protein [Aequorivita xiaoshiensis]MCG2432129.1 hypothetical protein [Aequorivita xiaoshiensis]
MKDFLRKKISVLFIFSILSILLCLTIMIFDFKSVNDPFGYGLIAMTVGIGLGLFGILVDFILSLIIKNKIALNITELIIVTLFLWSVWPE